MLYDYGPLRFSFTRGLVLTIVVPLLTVICLGGVFAHLNETSLQAGFQHVSHVLLDLYKQYPVVALAFHAAFFMRGFAYRRRYTNWGAHLLFFSAASAFAYYGYVRMLHPQQGVELSSVSDDIASAAASFFTPSRVTPPTNRTAQTDVPTVPSVPGVDYRENDLSAVVNSGPGPIVVPRDADGLYVVDAAIGPRRVRFVIDPTSDITTMPLAYASDLGVSKCDKTQVKSSVGLSDGCAFRVPAMLIGDMTLRDVDVVFLDVAERTSYIGQSVLRRFRGEYIGSTLRLTKK